MKPITLLLAFLITNASFSQVNVDGTVANQSIANNAPAEVVDPALVVTSAANLSVFYVRIGNFSSGDVLGTSGTLPGSLVSSYNNTTGVMTITGPANAATYEAALRMITFRTTSTSTTSRVITFDASDGSYKFFGDHYYKLLSGSYTWLTARTATEAVSLFGWTGYLATSTSAAENSFIFANVGRGWLGASDEFSQINAAVGSTLYANQAASEGKWFWVVGPEKGQQFSNGASVISGRYAAWSGSEPNNSNGEHFAENAYPNNGTWNDAQAGNNNNAIVEFGNADFEVDVTHVRTIDMIATQLNTTSTPTVYQLKAAGITVDPGVLGYSVSTFTQGKVTISSGFRTNDILSFTGSLPGTFSGTYNSSTGVLTFTTSTPASMASWQSLFRTVRFNSTSTTVGDRIVTFSVGNLVAASNGHFYEYISTGATWDNARIAADARTYMGLKGYLATITSSTENDFIRQTLAADAFIGLSDAVGAINSATGATTYADQAAAEGKWYWVTGPEKGQQVTSTNAPSSTTVPTPFGGRYNNWNNGEPNNSGNNEHAGTIYASGVSAGRWNDLTLGTSLGYVVEYGGLSSDPIVQFSSSRTVQISSVLPVRGLRLAVKQTKHDVAIEWTTEEEVNSSRFNVMHSTDGRNFSKITTVSAKGNSNSLSRYAFEHLAPGAGLHFYQLAQVDLDGAIHYSEVKSIQMGGGSFKVYPTLATAELTVTVPTASEPAQLLIHDAAGRAVIRHALTSSVTTIQVSGLAPGVYVAEMIQGSNREVTRFVKR